MPTILKLEDDPAEMVIGTLQGDVEINAMELASCLRELCGENKGATTEQLYQAVKEVGRGEAAKKLTMHQAFALGARVNDEYERLGKEPRPPQNSSTPTGS